MTKTPIAVALLMASSATPSLAHPFASHEVGYNRPVERTIERTVVRTTVAPAHQPAGHRHWRQSDWRRAHWHHNQGRRQDRQRIHWRRTLGGDSNGSEPIGNAPTGIATITTIAMARGSTTLTPTAALKAV